MTSHLDRRALRRALALAAVAAIVAPAVAVASYTPSPAAVRTARATERYYMSYGSPQVIPPPPVAAPAPIVREPEATGDGASWATTTITAFLASIVGGALGALGGGAVRLRRVRT